MSVFIARGSQYFTPLGQANSTLIQFFYIRAGVGEGGFVSTAAHRRGCSSEGTAGIVGGGTRPGPAQRHPHRGRRSPVASPPALDRSQRQGDSVPRPPGPVVLGRRRAPVTDRSGGSEPHRRGGCSCSKQRACRPIARGGEWAVHGSSQPSMSHTWGWATGLDGNCPRSSPGVPRLREPSSRPHAPRHRSVGPNAGVTRADTHVSA